MSGLLQKGYKQTEIGVIPNEWAVKELYDFITTLEAGISVNSIDTAEFHTNDKCVLKTSCIFRGRFYPEEAKVILRKDIKRARLNPRKDAIIVSRMNTPALVGEIGYIDADYSNLYLPDRLWQTKYKNESSIDGKWLAFILSFSNYANKIKETATGTSNSMKNIAKHSFLSVKVPAPSKQEQTAIANALSDVDALITSLEKLIAKKRAIKTAAMQQLLTGKKRLPPFDQIHAGYKQTELGEIPEDWQVRKIGSFTDCTAGGTPSTGVAAYWGGSNPWMSSGELHLKRVYDVKERITGIGLENSSTKYVPKFCVLMGLAGQGKTRGTVAINEIGLCTNQSIAAIFPSNEHVTDFLYYNLETRYDELRGMSTGDGGRGGLNLTIIRKVPVAMPSLEEQESISNVLRDIDKDIESLKFRLKKTQQLKQGMMQELLTGGTRLV